MQAGLKGGDMIHLFTAIIAFFGAHRAFNWIEEEEKKDWTLKILDASIAITCMWLCAGQIHLYVLNLNP